MPYLNWGVSLGLTWGTAACDRDRATGLSPTAAADDRGQPEPGVWKYPVGQLEPDSARAIWG